MTQPSRSQRFLRGKAFEERDRRRRANGGDERLHDRAAGRVALHAHDAPLGMGGLARGRQLPIRVIEGHAIGEKIVYARAGFARHAERDLRIDDAGAGFQRVLGVALRRIRVEHAPRRRRPAPRRRRRLRGWSPASARRHAAARASNAQNRPARPPPTMRIGACVTVKAPERALRAFPHSPPLRKPGVPGTPGCEAGESEGRRAAPLGSFRSDAAPMVIVGGGLAGLFCALKLAPRRVAVLTPAPSTKAPPPSRRGRRRRGRARHGLRRSATPRTR